MSPSQIREHIRGVIIGDVFCGWQKRTAHGWERCPAAVAKTFVRNNLDGERLCDVMAWLVGPVAHRPGSKPGRYVYFRPEPVDRSVWDEWDYSLWHSVMEQWSRRNIQRWLAGRQLPANLSAAGLESLYRQQCGRFALPSHFREIQQIN